LAEAIFQRGKWAVAIRYREGLLGPEYYYRHTSLLHESAYGDGPRDNDAQQLAREMENASAFLRGDARQFRREAREAQRRRWQTMKDSGAVIPLREDLLRLLRLRR